MILAKEDFLFSDLNLIQMERLQLTAAGSVSYLLPLLCNFWVYSSCLFWLFFFAFALQTYSFLIVAFFFCLFLFLLQTKPMIFTFLWITPYPYNVPNM